MCGFWRLRNRSRSKGTDLELPGFRFVHLGDIGVLSPVGRGKETLSIPMEGQLLERKKDPIEPRTSEDIVECDRCGETITDWTGRCIGILDEDLVPYQLCLRCEGLIKGRFGPRWAEELGATEAGVNRFWRWVREPQERKGRNWRAKNK